ncbi:MAG: SAM-dependent methyltransferase [Planctomycetota bacterium]|jgi:cyclopropane fatty-acyl-phospholipid synthase-like methyltransferase
MSLGVAEVCVVVGLRSAIYSLLIRKVTWVHYKHLFEMLPEGARVLDIGVGNGLMLDWFAPKIRQKQIELHGLDVHREYLKECRRRIMRHQVSDLVTVEQRCVFDYLEQVEGIPEHVYFSASFMLLPEPERLLELILDRLPEGGRVLFAQTLLERPNKFAEAIKPKLKFLTTVDFGRVQYRHDFTAQLEELGFEITAEDPLPKAAGNRHLWFHGFKRKAPAPALVASV